MKVHIFRTIGIVLLLISCQNKAMFESSYVVPAASGEIDIKELSEDLYQVEVEVQYLTRVENIHDKAVQYVAWATSRKDTQRIGALNRVAENKSMVIGQSEIEPEKVVITAEKNRHADKMSRNVVLTTSKL